MLFFSVKAEVSLPSLPGPCARSVAAITAIAGPKDSKCPDGYTRVEQDLSEGTRVHEAYHYLCFTRAGYVQGKVDIEDIQVVQSGSSSVSCPAGYSKIGQDLNSGCR